MAIKTAVPISAMAEFLQGTHQPNDSYKMALYTSKADLGANTAVYAASGEVKGNGYKAGGIDLKGNTVLTDSGVSILSFLTPVWERAEFVARGCVIYNADKGNKVIGVFDFGKDVPCSDGSFVATIPKATATEGLIRAS